MNYYVSLIYSHENFMQFSREINSTIKKISLSLKKKNSRNVQENLTQFLEEFLTNFKVNFT